MKWLRRARWAPEPPKGPDPNEHYPTYDPARRQGGRPDSYTPDDLVYAERFCSCGGILRIRGRVVQVAEWVDGFDYKHRDHRPASKAECIAAREEKRRRAMGADYTPKAYPNLRAE